MHIALTASSDACQHSAYGQEDENVLWLEPRSARPGRAGPWGRKALLNLTTSLGLGACLAVATATAAEPGEAQIALPPPAGIDLSGVAAAAGPDAAADPLR